MNFWPSGCDKRLDTCNSGTESRNPDVTMGDSFSTNNGGVSVFVNSPSNQTDVPMAVPQAYPPSSFERCEPTLAAAEKELQQAEALLVHLNLPPQKKTAEEKQKQKLISKLHLTPEEAATLSAKELKKRENVFTRKIEDHLSKLSSEFREGRGVGEFLSREPKERSSWRWWRWRLAIVVESSSASFFISLCVLLNAVFVALHADRKINESTYNALLAPFLTIFNIEIILKLLALGFKLYLSDIYNRFDFVIILASDIDVFILWVNWNVDGSRVLSILRLFRILRLVRVMSKLRRMELIIDAFMNGMKEVVWILMIATLVLFMGGVILTSWLAEHEGLPEEIRAKWFTNVLTSMLTLLQVMTLEWAEIVTTTGRYLPESYIFFVGYLILCGLGMMGLFGAVFVESLIAATADDVKQSEAKVNEIKHELQDDILDLLRASDVDESGTLDLVEMQIVLDVLEKNPEEAADTEMWDEWRRDINAKMASVGLEAHTIQSAVQLAAATIANADHEGIPYQRIVQSVFTMENTSTRGDSVTLQANLKRDIEEMKANQRRLEDLILRLLARDTGHGAPEGSPQLLAAQPDVKLALSLSSLGTPAN